MYIKKEITSFDELKNNSWSGAIGTLNRIEELELIDDFMELIEERFNVGETSTETDVNDFIWFETDYINECLGRNCEDLFDDEEEDN